MKKKHAKVNLYAVKKVHMKATEPWLTTQQAAYWLDAEAIYCPITGETRFEHKLDRVEATTHGIPDAG